MQPESNKMIYQTVPIRGIIYKKLASNIWTCKYHEWQKPQIISD